MISGKLRLILLAVIFTTWLGWLSFISFTTSRPVVLAPAQVMAATHFVLVEAKVDTETGKPETTQTISKTVGKSKSTLTGEILIPNLREARIAGQKQEGFQAGVTYLLPVTRLNEQLFELTPPPKAPGNERLSRGRPWAYVWNEQIERQLATLTE